MHLVMNNLKRTITISLSVISAVTISGLIIVLFFPVFLKSECENIITSTIKNPSNSYVAILFSRDCGATTSFTTNVSIIKHNQILPNKAGNIYIAEDLQKNSSIHWLNTNTLHIKGASYKTFKQKYIYDNIKLKY